MRRWIVIFLFLIVATGTGVACSELKGFEGRSKTVVARADIEIDSDQQLLQTSVLASPIIEGPVKSSLSGRYPLFMGVGAPHATVLIVKSNSPGSVLATTTADADGHWSVKSTVELPVGAYSISSRQFFGGQTSSWSVNVPFTVVDTLPHSTITFPVTKGTSDRYPAFAGRGLPLATVRVVKSNSPGTVLATTVVDALGRWSAKSNVELPIGPYSISSRQTLDGKTTGWSENIGFTVVEGQNASLFKVVEAPAGELNADTLGAEANVQVSYPSLAAKDTVGVRLKGVALRDAPIQTVSTVGVQTFKLPKAWFVENKDRMVSLTFTYKVGGEGNLITSAPLPIKVTGVTAPGDGPSVANELNALYSTASNTCPNSPGQGAWYCSGVLIRTVDDSTAFRAWNPSPGAVKLGGVSFSYMKTGIGMNQLQGSRTQGFVLETGQNFTANGGYPLRVLCSYPYDAGTLIRSAAGCGAASNFPSNSGPCAAQGLTTLAAWRAHFQQYPANSTNRYHHQCSFGVDKAGFELSLLSRENPAGELAAWRQNEVMIQTWPQNTSNLPIKAFIYFNTASRAVGVEGAKNIQRDFLKSTGRRIPVIKVSPNAATIFSYSAADQGI